MSLAIFLKFLHILSGMWFMTGLLGRGAALSQAKKTPEVQPLKALVELAGRFERLMVIPGGAAILLTGLLTAWVGGWPILGFLQGSGSNWVLVSILIWFSSTPLVIWVFLPRGRVFEAALQDALDQGRVTPELTAAFADRAVAAGHLIELLGVAAIIYLMVAKPF